LQAIVSRDNPFSYLAKYLKDAIPIPESSRKTGYAAHSFRRKTGSTRFCRQVLLKKAKSPRKYQSPREAGQRLHAIADRPNLLTPAISPQLGVTSQ